MTKSGDIANEVKYPKKQNTVISWDSLPSELVKPHTCRILTRKKCFSTQRLLDTPQFPPWSWVLEQLRVSTEVTLYHQRIRNPTYHPTTPLPKGHHLLKKLLFTVPKIDNTLELRNQVSPSTPLPSPPQSFDSALGNPASYIFHEY